MKKSDFARVESEEEFVRLLKQHNLFREDDVTFDDLSDGDLFVVAGNNFAIDAEMLGAMNIAGLLIEGDVRVDRVSISDVLPDFGVLCVTGNLHCQNMLYMTESTGVSIGGDLVVEDLFYADCGNSVLQVNGDFHATLLFNSQCSIDVRGEEKATFDENVTKEELETLGISIPAGESPASAIEEMLNQ